MQRGLYWLIPLAAVATMASLAALNLRALSLRGTPPGPSPAPLVQTPSPAVQPATCADCHADIVESLAAAPHMLTLRRPEEDQLAQRFVGRQLAAGDSPLHFFARDGSLWLDRAQRGAPQRVDWIFGSGHHALTPVSLIDAPNGTQLIQLHASWFADGAIGVTPGSEQKLMDWTTLGLLHTAEETRDCFGCHASYLPTPQGRFDYAELQAGVRCSRCHLQAAAHAESAGELRTFPAWPRLEALDAINRCGECHRRRDQFTPDELTPDNRLLIRFAPVGLALSPCFRANEPPFAGSLPRLDCLTCHDPHRRAATDAAFYVARCNSCHTGAAPQAARCAVHPDSDRCLDCHMPQVAVQDHLSFTDHWIRVRKAP